MLKSESVQNMHIKCQHVILTLYRELTRNETLLLKRLLVELHR